jgi:hypothetical protein
MGQKEENKKRKKKIQKRGREENRWIGGLEEAYEEGTFEINVRFVTNGRFVENQQK